MRKNEEIKKLENKRKLWQFLQNGNTEVAYIKNIFLTYKQNRYRLEFALNLMCSVYTKVKQIIC